MFTYSVCAVIIVALALAQVDHAHLLCCKTNCDTIVKEEENDRPEEKINRDLRSSLTEKEWRTLVGKEDTGIEFDVVWPRIQTGIRHRRSIINKNSEDKLLTVNAPNLGRKFKLDLLPSQDLLDPNFVVLKRWENYTDVLPPDLAESHCYYHSKGQYRAAISICGGVRGIITSQQDNYYIVNPLPQRFHKRSADIPHIIIRKNIPNERRKFYIPKKLITPLYEYKLLPKTRVTGNSSFFTENINSDNYNIFFDDSASFNPDNSKHDTFPNLNNNSQSRSAKNEKIKVERHTFCALNDHEEDNTSADWKKRKQRAVLALNMPVHVETAVFVDRDLFSHMAANFPIDTERELVRFVLAMVNAVQLLYYDPSLGQPVTFVMKRLEILHTDPLGLVRSHDIDHFLGNFCAWQRDENPPSDSDPLHWDHALILTGLDLYVLSKNGKLSSQVVGLAPVAGMCTATSSCTVNEGRHFESVYVVAHEIGHNLGMRHDGPMADNNCDPGSYLMSPTLGSGKITWSSCSRQYLQQFLQTPQSHCLMDNKNSAGQLDHSANGKLPGERFNADQQCMLKYGPGSHHSQLQPLHDLCRDLHCHRDRYTWTSHPALEGTMCGSNKWCRSGRCVAKGLSAVQAVEAVHGGWSSWGHFSDCASGCLHGDVGELGSGSTGVMVASRRCNNPRPENGGEPCAGSDRKYRTCIAKQCKEVPHTTIRDFADEICIRARDVDSELVGTGLQKISFSAEEACTVWCYKRNGGTKSHGWTFPDGSTCQTKSKFGSMYCISGICQEFTCERGSREDDSFKLSNEMCLSSRDKRREVAIGLWQPTSDCFFNCITLGTGVRLVEKRSCRHCNATASIQLCKPENPICESMQSSLEYATRICVKYSERVRRLSGLGMQLSPSLEDPDRACRIACQDENVLHRFYLVNGEDGWFPFGTDCSHGDATKKAYCIRGKCLEFGSDDTPLHESEYTMPTIATHKGRKRRRRSLQQTTTVTVLLDKHTLDQIVFEINKTGHNTLKQTLHDTSSVPVDLSNPVFVQPADWSWPSDVYNEVATNRTL